MSIFEKYKKLVEEGKEEEANKLLADHMAADVKGLKDKNEELLGKLKDAKTGQDELSKRLDAIEEKKNAALAAKATKAGDWDTLKKQLEDSHAKVIESKDLEIKALTGDKEKLTGQLHNHVVNTGLKDQLVKAKVRPELMEAATALITAKFKGEVGDNDGNPFAKFDGKAVDQFVTDWSQTDEGKNFVSADSNSGGGANGANGTGQGAGNTGKKTMSREEFSALSPADKSKASVEGVQLVD